MTSVTIACRMCSGRLGQADTIVTRFGGSETSCQRQVQHLVQHAVTSEGRPTVSGSSSLFSGGRILLWEQEVAGSNPVAPSWIPRRTESDPGAWRAAPWRMKRCPRAPGFPRRQLPITTRLSTKFARLGLAVCAPVGLRRHVGWDVADRGGEFAGGARSAFDGHEASHGGLRGARPSLEFVRRWAAACDSVKLGNRMLLFDKSRRRRRLLRDLPPHGAMHRR